MMAPPSFIRSAAITDAIHTDVTGYPNVRTNLPDLVGEPFYYDTRSGANSCGMEKIDRTWTVTQSCKNDNFRSFAHTQHINIDTARINFPGQVEVC